jgi:ribosomal protein S1
VTDQADQVITGEQPAPAPVGDLKPKMQLEGVITKIELYGAMVELDGSHTGWLHISRIREEPVNRISDVLSEGQQVTVWVHRVDPKTKRVDLTMMAPLGVTWDEMRRDQLYPGTITRVEKFGVFVDIGAERPGLVHVSEMARGYVGDPSQIAKVGDQVQVKIKDFDRRKKRIDLSMKDAEAQAEAADAEDGDEGESLPTAMEIALREAMAGARKAERGAAGRNKKQRSDRQEQEDILQRTLQQRSGRR